MTYYTYKINFVDGFYYFGSRKCEVKPEEDVYWGSPKTHKDKWKTTMFFKEILCVYDTSEECSDEETKLIKPVYKTDPFCLNRNCSGSINFTPEVRKKMRENHKGMKGKTRSPEQRQKISERMMGHTYNKGQIRSEETKQKISDSKRGKKMGPLSEETKQKIREIMNGKTHSDETKQKIGKVSKNTIWITDGTIRKRIPSTDPIPDGFVRGRILNTDTPSPQP